MGVLIERTAYFKTCGCGECWGTIVLTTGNRGLLAVSKQEARTSLARAVTLGLLPKDEQGVVGMQIDMSCLPNSADEADHEVRFKIAVMNLRGLKQLTSIDGPLTAIQVGDVEEFKSNLELLAKGSFDDYVREIFSSDDFGHKLSGEDLDQNTEGLPVC